MIITKVTAPTDLSARYGRHHGVAISRRDGPGAVCAAAKPTVRLGFIYIPNGTIQPMWVPTRRGKTSSCRRF